MFEISKRLSLPEGAELWTYGDLAIKGAGKTYAACVMAEEFVKAGIPIVAIDALGIWWGLRVGINGHEGLPVVVFGGEHKDISIPTKIEKGISKVDEDKLRLMVKAILEARMSAVIDTSEFSKGMRRRIVAIFVGELYRLNQKYGPRHVFLEEADEWIPQRLHGKDEWAASCFGAVDDLVRKGGNFLLGTTLITQRSAVLSKDVLSQVNCLIVLRIMFKGDKEAVQGWVESVADPKDKRIAKWYDSLKDLKNGEAWIWHPEEPVLFDRIQFRERETLHATREYFTRSQFEQKDITMMPVESFVAKFKKVFEPESVQKKIEVPIPPPKPIIRHRDQGLGPKFQQEWNKVEDEMDEAGLPKEVPQIEPKEIELEEKAIVMKITHSESIIRETTENLRGQVLFILYQAARPLSQPDIIKEANEHGWAIKPESLKTSMRNYTQEGLIVQEEERGPYRLPRFVRYDVKEMPA